MQHLHVLRDQRRAVPERSDLIRAEFCKASLNSIFTYASMRALKVGHCLQGLKATMVRDMGQSLLSYPQQSHMSSFGSLPNVPSLPALANAQASLAGPGMGYMPSMPLSYPQASMVQQPPVVSHMLSNYMQMMHWSQVR